MKNFKPGEWIVLLLTLAMCFAGLFLLEKFCSDPSLKSAFSAVLTAICMSIAIGVITNRQTLSDVLESTARTTGASLNILQSGLASVSSKWDEIDFKDLINRSDKNIRVTSIYSSTWLKNNLDLLRRFVQEKGGSLTFVFLDPNSEVVAALEDKFNRAPTIETDLKSKIETSIQNVQTIDVSAGKRGKKGKVVVYTQPFPPAYTSYEFDNDTVITLYLQNPGRSSDIPAFQFKPTEERNGIYDLIKQDIDDLVENHSTLVRQEEANEK